MPILNELFFTQVKAHKTLRKNVCGLVQDKNIGLLFTFLHSENIKIMKYTTIHTKYLKDHNILVIRFPLK